MLSKGCQHWVWPRHQGKPVTAYHHRTQAMQPRGSPEVVPTSRDMPLCNPPLLLWVLSRGRERQEEGFKPSSWNSMEVITVNYTITGNITIAPNFTSAWSTCSIKWWVHALQCAALIPYHRSLKGHRSGVCMDLKQFGSIMRAHKAVSVNLSSKSHKKSY